MPRKQIKDLIAELRSWLPNYDHKDYPTTIYRILASLPGGEELEDMGYEPMPGIGWHEAEQLGRVLTTIENKRDVEELIAGLTAEEDDESEVGETVAEIIPGSPDRRLNEAPLSGAGRAIVVRMDLGQGVAAYRFLVDADGTIRVYDDDAHHYTIHTGLRPAQERRVRAAWAERESSAEAPDARETGGHAREMREERWIISSRSDVQTYVDNNHPDFASVDGGRTALVNEILNADHPRFGTDWSEWLESNIDSIREDAAESLPSMGEASREAKHRHRWHWISGNEYRCETCGVFGVEKTRGEITPIKSRGSEEVGEMREARNVPANAPTVVTWRELPPALSPRNQRDRHGWFVLAGDRRLVWGPYKTEAEANAGLDSLSRRGIVGFGEVGETVAEEEASRKKISYRGYKIIPGSPESGPDASGYSAIRHGGGSASGHYPSIGAAKKAIDRAEGAGRRRTTRRH